MDRRKMLEIAVTVAFGVNLAAAYVIAFVWTPAPASSPGGFSFGIEQMYLFLHIAIIFSASFTFGTVIADISKTLIYTIVAAAIGATLAIAAITAPTIILTEYAMFMDTTMTVALVTIARFFIVGATFLVLGSIIGSFVGDSLSNRMAPDTTTTN